MRIIRACLASCLVLAVACGGTTTSNTDANKDAPKDTGVDRASDGGTGGSGGSNDARDAADVPGTDLGRDGSDGGPPACTTATECPGQDSECRRRACSAGVCGMANEVTGKVLAAQVIGDCKIRKCGADGQPAASTDDTDIPDDLNPCTRDACSNGSGSHMPAAKDTVCGNNRMCNATGQCVGCTAATDCPGTDNDCRTRTCIQSTCGFTYKPAGTKITDPTAGDCKGLQCDGLGTAQVADLTTDVPTDDNPCTLDQCNGGTPNHVPAPRNSTCGGGKVCDGASHCVQCLTAATCPGSDSDCQTRTCSAGACGVANAPAGGPVASQTAGDCKKNQCNGQGVVVSVNDDTDTHNDNNACTSEVCTNGTPSNPPLPANTGCGGALKCDGAGQCVGCVVRSDCEDDKECVTFACTSGMCKATFKDVGTLVAAQTAKDCKKNQCDGAGNIVSANDDADLPDDDLDCTTDVCTTGTPTNPPVGVGMSCDDGGGIKCNGNGACVRCINPIDCGANSTCVKHTCSPEGMCGRNDPVDGTDAGGQTTGDCQQVVCNGSGGTHSVNDNADTPDDSNICTADSCNNGATMFTPIPANNGMSCGGPGSTLVCDNDGHCVGCNVAADCGTDSACRTFACTDHMCVPTNIADGTAVPAGMQNPGDCKTKVCDGAGGTREDNDNDDVPNDSNVCTKDMCASGVASHSNELAGVLCSQNSGVQCDGAGTCGPTLVVVNEVESSDGANPDWIEIYNNSGSAIDISGWKLKDDDDTHIFTIPAATTIGAHTALGFDQLGFGLAAADKARLFDPTGLILFDSYQWSAHAAVTYGRCPDGTGALVNTVAATKGAVNSCQ